MKKIIDGKVYNTETATCVGEWSNGYFGNDYKYESEDLYQKKNGEFFLYGEGGAMSSYAVSSGNNSWTGSQQIKPMTSKEAYDWAMEHLTANEFEELFGTMSEDDSNHLLVVTIPEEVFQCLQSMASSYNKKISQIITELVNNKS